MSQKNEMDVVGHWIDSIADLVAKHSSEAGSNRQRVITYDRTTVTGLGRAFKAATEDSRFIPDAERVRAARHVYVMEEETRWGIASDRLVKLAEAGVGSAIQQTTETGRMLAPMKKLFGICQRYGVGISLETNAPGLVTISLTPQPKPQPVLKPKPPKMKFGRGL